MKALKMYWNNLTLIYKIIGLFAVPLLIVVSTIFSKVLFEDMPDAGFSFMGFGLLVGYILWEVLIDGWNFGGLYGKNFQGIALVKASNTGMKLYGQMIATDSLRRIVYFGLLAGICMKSVASGVIMGAVVTLAVMVSRFFPGYMSSLLLSYIAPIVSVCLVFMLYEVNPVVHWIVAIGIAIFATMLTVWKGAIMIENVKFVFALQKFGFQRRLQLGSMAIFYLIGVVIELATHGTFWLGMFFMMLAPMYMVQVIYSMCMSTLVTASPYGKRIQTSIVSCGDLFFSLVSMTIIVIMKAVEVALYPQQKDALISVFVILSVMMLVLHIYTAFVYKFYVLSIVLLFVIIWPLSFYMGYSVSDTRFFTLPTIPVSFVGAVLIAYASTLLGVGLQYVLTKLIYRVPLSKYAQGAAMRKYLKN